MGCLLESGHHVSRVEVEVPHVEMPEGIAPRVDDLLPCRGMTDGSRHEEEVGS